jgi:hypothetical protein
MTPFGSEGSTAPYVRMDKIKRTLGYRFAGRIWELHLFDKLTTSATESTLTRNMTENTATN